MCGRLRNKKRVTCLHLFVSKPFMQITKISTSSFLLSSAVKLVTKNCILICCLKTFLSKSVSGNCKSICGLDTLLSISLL